MEELYNNQFYTYVDIIEEGAIVFDQYVSHDGGYYIELDVRARKNNSQLQKIYDRSTEDYCFKMHQLIKDPKTRYAG